MKLIEIRRWLTQPHVWRFVGLGSSVVGLFCYAVSSSFNNLFGEWTFLKIFFYTQLSLIICIAIFYAKVWQSSRSLRFKGHMAFLVLTITSAYSFFLDNKAVKKKPDAFSLISCLAFSIMSLCLSRQIPCGFEVDLMYFFLGALIVQLMKIKLWLGILGVGFSYTLNILRSSLDENLHEGAGLQEDQRNVVIQVEEEEEEEESISPQPPRFMSVIQELQRANWGLVEVLWCHLKEYLVDKDDQIPIPMTLVNDHNFLINALPPKAVDDLHEKVKLMMDSGFKNECSNQYNSWRREFLEMCLSMLQLKVTNKIEGVDERERIRSDVVTTLQKLANDFVTERRSSLTRLPSMVKVVGTLQDLIPELDDSVFAAQRSEAVSIMELETLEEATKDYYCTNIENLI
ncbi:uncharacterized protein LOC130942026 [Arachis stenosperma]|uniref:uncharacterized protein LOC130942026 n=1 Tax=Arachis stenosperma TaxID=217475 RepID=UPI0025AB6BEF|nr:uncharacterized protein LOC130942026 [Arachis stenosperma]